MARLPSDALAARSASLLVAAILVNLTLPPDPCAGPPRELHPSHEPPNNSSGCPGPQAETLARRRPGGLVTLSHAPPPALDQNAFAHTADAHPWFDAEAQKGRPEAQSRSISGWARIAAAGLAWPRIFCATDASFSGWAEAAPEAVRVAAAAVNAMAAKRIEVLIWGSPFIDFRRVTTKCSSTACGGTVLRLVMVDRLTPGNRGPTATSSIVGRGSRRSWFPLRRAGSRRDLGS